MTDVTTLTLAVDRINARASTVDWRRVLLVALMVLWNQQIPTSRLLWEDLFSAQHARLPS